MQTPFKVMFKPKAQTGLAGTLSGEPGALPLEKTYNGKLKPTTAR